MQESTTMLGFIEPTRSVIDLVPKYEILLAPESTDQLLESEGDGRTGLGVIRMVVELSDLRERLEEEVIAGKLEELTNSDYSESLTVELTGSIPGADPEGKVAGGELKGVESLFEDYEFLRVQIRAILTLFHNKSVRILAPAVSDLGDLSLIRNEIVMEAQCMGLSITPKLGAMVENCAGLSNIDRISCEADFIYIDCDRLAEEERSRRNIALDDSQEFGDFIGEAINSVLKNAGNKEVVVNIEGRGLDFSTAFRRSILVGAERFCVRPDLLPLVCGTLETLF